MKRWHFGSKVFLSHDLGVLHAGRLGEDSRDEPERLGELPYGVLHADTRYKLPFPFYWSTSVWSEYYTYMTPNLRVAFW